MNKRPKCKTGNYKIHRSKHRYKNSLTSVSEIFVDLTPEARERKAKIDNSDYIKLKKLLHSEGNHHQKAVYWMGEDICNIYDKLLKYSKYVKNIYNFLKIVRGSE